MLVVKNSRRKSVSASQVRITQLRNGGIWSGITSSTWSQKCPGRPESAKDLPENARFSLCEEPTLPFSPNHVELFSLPALYHCARQTDITSRLTMYYHTPNHQLNIHFPPTRNPFLFSTQANANANDILRNLGIPEAEEEIIDDSTIWLRSGSFSLLNWCTFCWVVPTKKNRRQGKASQFILHVHSYRK